MFQSFNIRISFSIVFNSGIKHKAKIYEVQTKLEQCENTIKQNQNEIVRANQEYTSLEESSKNKIATFENSVMGYKNQMSAINTELERSQKTLEKRDEDITHLNGKLLDVYALIGKIKQVGRGMIKLRTCTRIMPIISSPH